MLFDCCTSGLFNTTEENSIMKNKEEVVFNKKLKKQFHNLVECPATILKRISMLESMESLFAQPLFIYENEEDCNLGMKYLIAIWEIILNELNNVKLHDRYVLYRFIIYICYRKEFLLERNGFDAEELCIASERMAYIKHYLYLLKMTLIQALVIIKDSSNSMQLLFASKVIAIGCSRLPEVGEVIFTALRDLQNERPCPFADIRFDIFNEDERDSESYHQQYSSPVLDIESISPSISNSMPKSFSMSAFPSDIQESYQDWALTQSESYDSDDDYSTSSYSEEDEEDDDDNEDEENEEEEEEDENDEEEEENDEEDENEEEEEEEEDNEEDNEDDDNEDEASEEDDYQNDEASEEDDYQNDYFIDDYDQQEEPHVNQQDSSHILQDLSPIMVFNFENDIIEQDGISVSPPVSQINQDMLDGITSPSRLSVSPQLSLSADELPPLEVIDYTVVVDKLCYEALHNQELIDKHDAFTVDYPSLYWWCIIPDSSIECETSQWWVDRFSIRDGFFFTFIRCWFELLQDYYSYKEKELLFPCIPGYFAILRCFLPSLQSCIIHQYHCSHIRSHYTQSSYSYNMAALKASESALIDTSLLNILVELLFSQCNAYFINDVLTCFLYLEQWLQFIRSNSIASTLKVKSLPSFNNNPEIAILLSLERYIQIEYKNASRRKLSNLDYEESIYLKHGIKDGFLRHHAIEALIVSGLVMNDVEANEAWNRLLDEDCLKQVRYDYVLGQAIWQVRKRMIKPMLYSESSSIHLPLSFDYTFFFKGLHLLLEQEHVIILKQFLLFFYNNSDMFYSQYREEFILHSLFTDFYRLFCHWDVNVRFIFHLILLYRCLHTRRSSLPVLTSNVIISKISIDKWKQISSLESTKNEKDTIERLIMTHEKWRKKRKIVNESGESMICESKSSLAIYDSSLDNDNDTSDLVIAKQIDDYLLQIIQQINHPEQMIISVNKRHAMILSLAEYIRLLKDYEKMDKKNDIIEAPLLDSTILVVDQGISTGD